MCLYYYNRKIVCGCKDIELFGYYDKKVENNKSTTHTYNNTITPSNKTQGLKQMYKKARAKGEIVEENKHRVGVSFFLLCAHVCF